MVNPAESPGIGMESPGKENLLEDPRARMPEMSTLTFSPTLPPVITLAPK